MTEDLTTYTEYDMGGYLSKTSSRATASAMDKAYDAYIYKDFGESFFDKIDLYFAIYINSTSQSGSEFYIAFANNVNDASAWTQFISVYIGPGIVYFQSPTAFDVGFVSNNTVYYLRLRRTAGSGTAYLYIYSDSARTVLVDTLTISLTSTYKFRYFYPAANYNDGTIDHDFYGYAENFLLASPVGGQVRVIGMMM